MPIAAWQRLALESALLRRRAAVDRRARKLAVEADTVVLPVRAAGATAAVIAAQGVIDALVSGLDSVPQPCVQALFEQRREPANLRLRVPVGVQDERQRRTATASVWPCIGS
jgi:hypothetical protein